METPYEKLLRKMNKMNITLLTGSNELNFSLDRYLRFLFPGEIGKIFLARLNQPDTLEPEMNDAHLWVIEALDPEEYQNPQGFRTAKTLAGKCHILLLFLGYIPRDFPREGSFWIYLPSSISIASKLREILAQPPVSLEDFLDLEKRWPILKRGPSNHHHREVKRIFYEE